ncbi:GntR family transcriptional regulator [Spirochaeta cellobiosiphila]|uniref:GntR family transcriptional regulator n=1 Tax=Spirochaeta cellobiosiphila TaxID=504483 RepID=UPI00040F9F0B|nr:GntR family transcriptional regulator [Spirochaeta cellobiosiphila]
MDIIIKNNSQQPLYEQIRTQIKSQIMEGILMAGDILPSIRGMAKDLHISVITVQKAYEQLNQDGFIETIIGKGSFVASQNPQMYREEQLRKIEHHIEKAVQLSQSSGVKTEELVRMIKIFRQEFDK